MNIIRLRIIGACTAVMLLSLAIYAPEAYAQRFRPDSEFSKFRLSSDEEEQKLKDRFSDKALQKFDPLATEGAIDPAAYLLGPGDILAINIWGTSIEDLTFQIPISADGNLIIPTIGSLSVRNKSLADIQAGVVRESKKKYDARSISVTTHLAQMRLIRVHVYGEVNEPGSYIGTPVERVSQFIQKADGASDWADLRRIQISRRSGEEISIDLSTLYRNGKLENDPYVNGGDVILVPAVDLSASTIFVDGHASLQGYHQISENETLKAFLDRMSAINRESDAEELVFLRDGEAAQKIDLFGGKNGKTPADAIRLKSGDKILLSSVKKYIYVHGAVRNPGYFPFIPGYRAIDYVGLAGGTEEMGSVTRIKVLTSVQGEERKGAQSEVKRGDSIFVPSAWRARVSDYLTVAAQIASILIAARAVGIINPVTKPAYSTISA